MNYAIFRTQPINTLQDLAQIGSHNKREKKAYNSNPDIKLEESKNNIELVPLNERYVKGFKNITKEYEKEHNERMKTERPERKKTFNQILNKSRNVVADELLFTATHQFFDNMTEYDIKEWANTCMEFVYKDLGYTKEQVLHATVHMDEKTPHIHCVVIPLVRKFDKRTNTERYTISKKQYIKNKIHLSELQSKYHQRLVEKGYDLERGIIGSDADHISIKDYKKLTRKFKLQLDKQNKRLDNAMIELERKMVTSKNVPFDKKHIILEKETFDSMNKVIKETKQVMELQPKIETIFTEINNYTNSYNSLEKQNKKYEKEINYLKNENNDLIQENNHLKAYIGAILKAIKQFFRKLLQIGNDKTKEATTSEIKDYYDNNDFDMIDVKNISKGTSKEDELFEYANVPDYLKSSSKEKDDYEIEL